MRIFNISFKHCFATESTVKLIVKAFQDIGCLNVSYHVYGIGLMHQDYWKWVIHGRNPTKYTRQELVKIKEKILKDTV